MDGPMDLGVCEGSFVRRDPERAAILLPGADDAPRVLGTICDAVATFAGELG